MLGSRPSWLKLSSQRSGARKPPGASMRLHCTPNERIGSFVGFTLLTVQPGMRITVGGEHETFANSRGGELLRGDNFGASGELDSVSACEETETTPSAFCFALSTRRRRTASISYFGVCSSLLFRNWTLCSSARSCMLCGCCRTRSMETSCRDSIDACVTSKESADRASCVALACCTSMLAPGLVHERGEAGGDSSEPNGSRFTRSCTVWLDPRSTPCALVTPCSASCSSRSFEDNRLFVACSSSSIVVRSSRRLFTVFVRCTLSARTSASSVASFSLSLCRRAAASSSMTGDRGGESAATRSVGDARAQ
eukprot:Rhum_TRINITY_DN4621_c0_g1::Rhum_TRINITY_DN4621_c0_g1_i1::g.15093::m.15093